ncbi:MAG: hypothetical protein JNL28_06925 [Planctomycetes bacterium]|nr:hypothetical protein [Planctomycetota bacterium]
MKSTRAGRRSAWSFACIAACLLLVAALGPWREAPVECLALLAVAGAAWLVAVRSAEQGGPSFAALCAGALLLRAIALASQLDLSDDVVRYVFEGELVNRGISPYAFGPADPALAAVRDELPQLTASVAHPTVPAIYPPLVHGVSALAARVAGWVGAAGEFGAVAVLRVFFTIADLCVLWPLAALLRRAGRPPTALVAWAFCPLVALEFAGSAHLDALGILLLLLALVALARADESPTRGREIGASALLAAAVATKYLPLLVLPWLGDRARGWKRGLWVGVFTILSFAPFVWMVGGERGLGGGLGQYGERWEGGSLVFRFVRGAAEQLFEPSAGWSDPARIARLVVAALWLAWAAFVVVRVRERVRGLGLLVAGFLVLTPMLHPWYLTWMLPFVALQPSRAWLWLIAAAPLLYAPLAGWQNSGSWVEPAWMWPVLAVPFFALLLCGRSPLLAPRPPA